MEVSEATRERRHSYFRTVTIIENDIYRELSKTTRHPVTPSPLEPGTKAIHTYPFR